MKQVFRWIDKNGDIHEYRFTDGICDGFFTNNIESEKQQNYKGKPITDIWLNNLPQAGFKEVALLTDKQ